MPYICCVTACKGNYSNGPKVSVFRFPREEQLRAKWIAAIPRKNFNPTEKSKVCELHFDKHDILYTTEYYDEKTGRNHIVQLKKPRLRDDSVPSVFEGCPKYLSASSSHRLFPRKKRNHIEEQHIAAGIEESLKSYNEYQEKYCFKTLDELSASIKRIKIHEMFTVIQTSECFIISKVTSHRYPEMEITLAVDKNLSVNVYEKNVMLQNIGKYCFPLIVNDVNVLLEILNEVAKYSQAKDDYDTTSSIIDVVVDMLTLLKDKVSDDQKTLLQFLVEQLTLLGTKKNHKAYSSEFLILCCLVFSISPRAYRFLRKSYNIILPHPSTLLRLCSKFNMNPKLEQRDEHFLKYAKQKVGLLKPEDKVVSLMLDEIHLKPILDYSDGSLIGMSYNCEQTATSAYVFMIQSIRSSYRDVVHVFPAKTLTADILFHVIEKVVVGLEEIAFTVISLVTDNNAINRKSVSYFANPPKLSIVYPLPVDATRPLFFLIDVVHLLKCIRNNWLNQKDFDHCMCFPDFYDPNVRRRALLAAVKKLHELESDNLVQYGYGLTFKALNPSNLERQNVKLALQVFNVQVAEGLLVVGSQHQIPNYQDTAEFIKIICKFWDIANVRTPVKGIHKRNEFQEPLTDPTHDVKADFLYNFLNWLDRWENMGLKSGTLSKETHLALKHTVYALLEITQYCVNELNMTYILTGKFQTDLLEERFGKYRQLAGCQYNISVRQVLKCENKLRIQSFMPLILQSHKHGDIKCDITEDANYERFNYNFSDTVPGAFSAIGIDLANPSLQHSLCINICSWILCTCHCCSCHLVLDKYLSYDKSFELIKTLDGGGLKYPSEEIFNIIIASYLVMSTLLSGDYEMQFLQTANHRCVALNVIMNALARHEIFLEISCINGHSSDDVLKLILRIATNVFLNNYTRKVKEKLKIASGKRKIYPCKAKVIF